MSPKNVSPTKGAHQLSGNVTKSATIGVSTSMTIATWTSHLETSLKTVSCTISPSQQPTPAIPEITRMISCATKNILPSTPAPSPIWLSTTDRSMSTRRQPESSAKKWNTPHGTPAGYNGSQTQKRNRLIKTSTQEVFQTMCHGNVFSIILKGSNLSKLVEKRTRSYTGVYNRIYSPPSNSMSQ